MENYKDLNLQQLLSHQNDSASWYWIGMAYWEGGDLENGANWLKKTMLDTGNEWAGKATLNLGLINESMGNKDEALRLFESITNGVLSRMNAGFLYCDGTETKRDPAKGLRLIEEALAQLIIDDGDDEYLSQHECFRVGQAFYMNNVTEKAKEYFNKCINRCNLNYRVDQQLADLARMGIQRLS